MPYARYGESIDSVSLGDRGSLPRSDAANRACDQVGRDAPGAARNAIDCALWELKAKRAGTEVWRLAGLDSPPRAVRTMRTVSVDSAEKMKTAAAELARAPVIKVKVDGGADMERIEAVHEAAPDAELVVDANEAWSEQQLAAWLPATAEARRRRARATSAAREDAALEASNAPCRSAPMSRFTIGARSRRSLGRYDMVNIKLDKTGGLSEALHCTREAKRLGLQIMLGCMVSTSLSIEPALLLASEAKYIDLDGPLLLERDRDGALHDRDAGLLRPSGSIWGAG